MDVAGSEGAEAKNLRFESIEELFLELESPLLAYARRLAPNTDMAEDLVQEAFIRLHRQWGQVQSPRSWLYRTVHNLALNQRRIGDRMVCFQPSSDTGAEGACEPADQRPLPDEQIARWEGVGLVRLNLENLDERSQELLRLKFTEGLSYKAISQRTGLSVGYVGYLLHHSLKALAVELANAGLVP